MMLWISIANLLLGEFSAANPMAPLFAGVNFLGRMPLIRWPAECYPVCCLRLDNLHRSTSLNVGGGLATSMAVAVTATATTSTALSTGPASALPERVVAAATGGALLRAPSEGPAPRTLTMLVLPLCALLRSYALTLLLGRPLTH